MITDAWWRERREASAGFGLAAPFDFRTARKLHRIEELATALRTYTVIGGVATYARGMLDGDLLRSASDVLHEGAGRFAVAYCGCPGGRGVRGALQGPDPGQPSDIPSG